MKRSWVSVLLTAMILLPSAARAGDPWDLLQHIQHKRTYTVMDKQSNCYKGLLGIVAADHIYLERNEGQNKMLDRSDVVRIADEGLDSDIIYTTRSSWADVKAIKLLDTESLAIVTKKGKKIRAEKGSTVVDDRITLRGEKPRVIFKDEIATVDYIRVKPVSDGAEYNAREQLTLVTPELWPYALHMAPKIKIRIYDAAQPEDNAPLKCVQSDLR